MSSKPSTISCLRCNTVMPLAQYECPNCGKPNLKAVVPASIESGRWVLVVGGGFFGLIGVLSLLQWIVVLTR
ncbi:MAG: hypothetical protein ACKVP7_04895 [Hyphomicrobiaceae bacterium]|jgi:hypothetical protein